MTVPPKNLVDRMSPVLRRSLEAAIHSATWCEHYQVTPADVLAETLREPHSDVLAILRVLRCRPDVLAAHLDAVSSARPKGNRARPIFSGDLWTLAADAWLYGSLEHDATTIRSGHVFVCLARKPVAYDDLPFMDVWSLEDLERVVPTVFAEGDETSPESALPAVRAGLHRHAFAPAHAKEPAPERAAGDAFYARLTADEMARVTSGTRKAKVRNPATGQERFVEIPGPPRFPRWRDAIEAAPKIPADPEIVDDLPILGLREPYSQKGWTAHLVPDPLAFAADDPALEAWLEDIRCGAYVWLVVERPSAD